MFEVVKSMSFSASSAIKLHFRPIVLKQIHPRALKHRPLISFQLILAAVRHFGTNKNAIMLKRVINDINVHINESFLQLNLGINKLVTDAVSQDNKDSFPPTAAFDVNQQNEFHNQLQSFPTLKKDAPHCPYYCS